MPLARPPGGISLCVTAPCLPRRADRYSALNLERSREVSFPGLPRNYLLNQYVNSQDQNPPVVPTNQTLPIQEPGTRPPVP